MRPLIILGGSTRAAACSARRAGFDPICGDLYADADLQRHAHALLSVGDYPRHLDMAVSEWPPDVPWMYTGGLENFPGEVDLLARRLTLWGNSGEGLRKSRDPFWWSAVLQAQRLPVLELRSDETPPPQDGNWMLKPVRSAGGRNVSRWLPNCQPLREPAYFQEFKAGLPVSAIFLAGKNSIELCGTTLQLIGLRELNGTEFGYCGTLYPCPDVLLTPQGGRTQIEATIRHIGETLIRHAELRGLVGLDFIIDETGPWLLEINPRYTASMELLELYSQTPILEWHRRACVEPAADNTWPQRTHESLDGNTTYLAKVIYFADRDAIVPNLERYIPSRLSLDDIPGCADIPVTGSKVWQSHPVFTCLGRGTEPDHLVRTLVQRAQALWADFPAAEKRDGC